MTDRVIGVRAATTLTDLGFASIAAGVLARRRPVVRVLEKMQADARAVERMKRLRREFGCGPVELVIPGRRIVVVLDPEDVGRVLAEAPTPFHPANREKRKALEWFQPHGVLISEGPIRQQRRAVNEAALDSASDVHRLASSFVDVVCEESRGLAVTAAANGHLDSAQFMKACWRYWPRTRINWRAHSMTLSSRSRLR